MNFNKVLWAFKYKIIKHQFLRNVMTLISGTIIAQVLTAAISPVLTRLYTPGEFGIYALYLSVSSVMAVLLAGRYEMAIVLPKKHEDGLNLVFLCIILSSSVLVLLTLIMLVCGRYISLLLNAPDLQVWLELVPFNAFFAVLYQTLYYWFNRTQQYSVMSKSRVISAVFTALISITLGWYKSGVIGLILATLLGQLTAIVIMAYIFIKTESDLIKNVTITKICKQAVRYIDFPKFLVMSHSINALSSQLPVILLNSFFGNTVVGYFSLAQRVVSMPLSLIGQSVGDVFRQRASDEYKIAGSCPFTYIRTLKTLCMIGVLPCLLLFFVAPQLFGLVFGENWIEAGQYTSYLSIMFYFELISSPLSMMFMIAEKQRMDLLFQFFRICFICCSLYIGYLFFAQPSTSIFLYSVGFAIVHIVNMLFTSRWAKVDIFKFFKRKK